MLGLILVYFIGKQFYTLAEDRNKSKWLYAFIGIGLYYLGTILGATLIVIYLELFGNGTDSINETALGIMGIPFGLLSVWGMHKILDKKWIDKKVNLQEEIAQIGLTEEELEDDYDDKIKF